jgi:hypothetical protein
MADIAWYPVTLAERDQTFQLGMTEGETFDVELDSAVQITPVKDYEVLDNKPQIEGVTLIGDKTFEDLNLQRVSNAEIEELFSNL